MIEWVQCSKDMVYAVLFSSMLLCGKNVNNTGGTANGCSVNERLVTKNCQRKSNEMTDYTQVFLNFGRHVLFSADYFGISDKSFRNRL